jgi:hypothetical protein
LQILLNHLTSNFFVIVYLFVIHFCKWQSNK